MTRDGTGPKAMDADALVRSLMEQPVAPMSGADAHTMRRHVIAAMNAQQTRIRRRAAAAPWIALAAAACLPVAMWAGAKTIAHGSTADAHAAAVVQVAPLAGQPMILQGHSARPLDSSNGAWLEASDELSTGPEARAKATLPTGATVTVAASSRLRFDASSTAAPGRRHERIELANGRIEIQVPKLAPGDDLRVQAGTVSVVVHGTRFSVEAIPVDAKRKQIRVAVIEGTVAVDDGGRKQMLTGGASWMSGADAEAAPAAAPAAQPSGRSAIDVRSPPIDRRSTLAAENGLLQAAMAYRRQGEAALALGRLDELLRLYPRSPLADVARAERLRVLADLADAGARMP